MTILEAIKAVLRKEKDGLTCKEITNRILSEKLYAFNTADPNSIVGHSLRRHCQGDSTFHQHIRLNISTLFLANAGQPFTHL